MVSTIQITIFLAQYNKFCLKKLCVKNIIMMGAAFLTILNGFTICFTVSQGISLEMAIRRELFGVTNTLTLLTDMRKLIQES